MTSPTPDLPEAFRVDVDGEVPRSACTSLVDLQIDPVGSALAEADGDASEEQHGSSPGGSTRKFRAIVNSGGVIPRHWFWGNFAIDLEGLSIPKQQIPLLRDHDAGEIVGKTTKVAVEDGEGLVAEGEILGVTDAGKDVLSLAEAGFPFQMSAWFPPKTILRVEEDEEVEVNGHTLKGPGHVFKTSEILEATVTALGADSNTSLALLSAGQAGGDTIPVHISRLSDKDDSMSNEDDADEVRTISAEEADRLAEQRADEARIAERQRLAGIDELAAGSGVPAELVSQFKNDGSSPEKFAVAIVEWQKANRSDLLAALQANAPKPSGTAPTDDDDSAGDEEEFVEGQGGDKKSKAARLKAIEAMPEGEDRWKAEFVEGVEGTDEFLDEGQYVGFRFQQQLQGV